MVPTDEEPKSNQPSRTPPADTTERKRLVIGDPFELESREHAHKRFDHLAAEHTRRTKQK